MSEQVIEKYGRDFTPFDVSRAWLAYQPKDAYCTAERVAFCNFVKGFEPPESAIYKNPYREWIGAQIRADYFGYINPGNPELAAEMAWRDASISHTKNGIYGEMFVAAKGWGAFLNGNPIRVTRNEVLSRAVVGTGFPVDKMNTTDNNIDNFSRVLPVVRDVRRLGSAAMDICYVAAGVLDAFWELNLHEWDVCAALLIASEAGAEYEYFRNDRNVSVLVGSPAIKNAIRPLLSSQPG